VKGLLITEVRPYFVLLLIDFEPLRNGIGFGWIERAKDEADYLTAQLIPGTNTQRFWAAAFGFIRLETIVVEEKMNLLFLKVPNFFL